MSEGFVEGFQTLNENFSKNTVCKINELIDTKAEWIIEVQPSFLDDAKVFLRQMLLEYSEIIHSED